MKVRVSALVAAAGAAFYALAAPPSAPAVASPVCTRAPPSNWAAEARLKTRVARMGYRNIRAFRVSGSCYEVHATTRDGRRAELYLNPVTGAIVQIGID